MGLYNVIFRAMPKKYREWMKTSLNYADFTIPAEKYAGFVFLYGILLGFVSLIILLFVTTRMIAILVGLSVFIIFEIVFHSIILLASDSRAKFTDEVLPDALRLMASNIKSGLTPDRALMLSARPEFGPLEREIRKSAKKMFSGESMEEAIQSISKNIDSQPLKRSMDLLSEGIRQGGNLAHLLDGLADDIRQTKILKREVKAYVMMYVIFIFFAVGIGAPLLYAISSYLVQTMTEIGKAINVEETATIGTGGMTFMGFKGAEVSERFLMMYSLLSIAITSIFGGILIGLVQEGSERAGIKYAPVLLMISISVHFLSKMMIAKVLGAVV